MTDLHLIVVAMALVTYLPRMIPMVFLDRAFLPPSLRRFLEFIPYTVLASLIFPGILTAVDPLPAALTGALTATVLAWLRLNLVLVVLGAILAVFVTGQLV